MASQDTNQSRRLTTSWWGDVKLALLTSWIGFWLLVGQLGFFAALGTIVQLKWRRLKGQPFAALPAPQSPREAASRKQSADAFVLYDVLSTRLGADRAYALVEQIVVEAGVRFMELVVPPIEKSEYDGLSDEERRAKLAGIAAGFPNIEVDGLQASAEVLSFNVVRCDFNQLGEAIERTQVSPAFCACDAVFFEQKRPEVSFERPHTLSTGSPHCDFCFRWRT
ncbi:MAG: hypothetical protein AUK47_28210 [Deltaproteobacteria bacterium CG2_30_63_29]|nr:MAG: hypothetical protein AUK47_28210 [Deltaproteobacteria bacterium CG2_30_63_29]PJB41691.1 MAG: hypothetical protein CO108_12740 [Deltaproteobacteria bacterium CG_4_9_14_3_um_filter_63_12]